MSRTNGVYTAPVNGFKPAAEGAVIDSADWNELQGDLETALTETVYTGGNGATDNAFLRTNGTDTKKAQGSVVTADDTGIVRGVPTAKLNAYTLATLPNAAEGKLIWVSDARKGGETAGAGTGVPAFFDGDDWIALDTGAPTGSVAPLLGSPATIAFTGQSAEVGVISIALVKKSADQTAANYSTDTAVTWDTETVDTNNLHSTSLNTSRLTVPNAVSYVRLSACIAMTSVTATSRGYAYFTKNTDGVVPGLPLNSKYFPSATDNYINLVSAPVAVSPGDYFEVVVICNDVSITIEDFSWFAMERVG